RLEARIIDPVNVGLDVNLPHDLVRVRLLDKGKAVFFRPGRSEQNRQGDCGRAEPAPTWSLRHHGPLHHKVRNNRASAASRIIALAVILVAYCASCRETTLTVVPPPWAELSLMRRVATIISCCSK